MNFQPPSPNGAFLRLLFLQAHRETAAQFTELGMQAQQQCDSFRYRRAAFYNGLKNRVGLAAAKAAALRVNLNINGCSIVAPPARPSQSSRASLIDTLLSPFALAARTLVRGGPTRPQRPRLVASHSTRPPSSNPPRAQL